MMAVYIFCFGMGWYVSDKFAEARMTATLEKTLKEKDAAIAERDKFSALYEKAIADKRDSETVLNQQLEKELAKNHSYTCKLPNSGVQFLNRAVAAGAATR